jgi:hypothetical protein
MRFFGKLKRTIFGKAVRLVWQASLEARGLGSVFGLRDATAPVVVNRRGTPEEKV